MRMRRKAARKPVDGVSGVGTISNAYFYRDCYLAADFAFNCYCEECLERNDPFCRSEEACKICHARWYTMKFDSAAHDRMLESATERSILPFPNNEEAENALRRLGLVRDGGRRNVAGKKETVLTGERNLCYTIRKRVDQPRKRTNSNTPRVKGKKHYGSSTNGTGFQNAKAASSGGKTALPGNDANSIPQ